MYNPPTAWSKSTCGSFVSAANGGCSLSIHVGHFRGDSRGGRLMCHPRVENQRAPVACYRNSRERWLGFCLRKL